MRLKLNQERKIKKKSVKELAKELGISYSYYYKIEKGIRNPNMALMKKIADYFQKTVDEIFFNDNMDKMSRTTKSA